MEINKIYNESNLDTMAKMPDCFIDLTITSPPYDGLRNYNGYSFPFEEIAKELYRVTKQGGVVVWVVGDQTIDGSETGTSFKQALYFMQCGFKLHDTMIYARYGLPQNNKRYEQGFEYMFVLSKGCPNTFNAIRQQRKYIDLREPKHRVKDNKIKGLKNKPREFEDTTVIYNIWRYAIGGGNVTKDKCAYEHPAIFPELLAYDHIKTWTNENDLVYDCFMGSGTTAKVAIVANRKYIGSEISEEYCKIIDKRLEPMLNNLFTNL